MKNKKNSKVWIVGIIVGAILIGVIFSLYYFKDKTESSEEVNMTLMINKDFSIQRPSSWNEYKNPNIAPSVGSMSVLIPGNVNITDNPAEKMLITVAYFPKGNSPDLNEMLDEGLNATRRSMPDLELVEGPDPVTMGGLEGIKMKFTGTSKGQKMEFTQISVKDPKTIYTISYHCLFDDCSYYGIFDKMVASFIPNTE